MFHSVLGRKVGQMNNGSLGLCTPNRVNTPEQIDHSKLILGDLLFPWWFLRTSPVHCLPHLLSTYKGATWMVLIHNSQGCVSPANAGGHLLRHGLCPCCRGLYPEHFVCCFRLADWLPHSLKSCLRKCQVVFLDEKLGPAASPPLSYPPSTCTEQSAVTSWKQFLQLLPRDPAWGPALSPGCQAALMAPLLSFPSGTALDVLIQLLTHVHINPFRTFFQTRVFPFCIMW